MNLIRSYYNFIKEVIEDETLISIFHIFSIYVEFPSCSKKFESIQTKNQGEFSCMEHSLKGPARPRIPLK